MELRIGIADNAQPITVTLPDGSDREAVKASVEAALGGEAAVLWLTDDKGREIAVASSRLTHVEMGPPGSNPIGFG
ncbi:MAG: DUF3107 domain-containing protein [Acidimicrobiaceae bacterium]|nr:DUF3107 domain-containing protein [Acidimicrobiaceae bacterium]MCY3643939.1 DUF3107 domain-containing protein [Acidimicrobiaceae bacterium]MDE0492960.1 DUF3107 domain-containing protein [Acidimicrobiaceae bacterium]MDE0665082.1 DUF3107 domain-containing protein [Acidimicrobiaceae bacterium]MXY11585.1 DUF3107 domain-containing protein [Acidimicrobiaceae bacterium]